MESLRFCFSIHCSLEKEKLFFAAGLCAATPLHKTAKERKFSMRVTFITHSSYFVELNSCCLLFDYTEGAVPETDKPLYVFASHGHSDHFSPAVFHLSRENRETYYLLSDDIWEENVPEALREQVLFISSHQTYAVGAVKVAALESTDLGVAFLVQCDGKLLYHAGDLNCWVWDGAPKYQNDAMTEQYRQELEFLRGRKIDVAFVPLDPRQEQDFDLGMKLFFEAADAKCVFPMHMWEDYSVVPLFKSTPGYEDYARRLMDVSKPGQEFVVE